MAKRKVADESEKPAAFEDSLTELQSIVSELEAGSLGLETSLARFERGVGLLRTCYSILESAEQKVELLTRFNAEGQSITEQIESSATIARRDDREDRVDDTDSGAGNGNRSDANSERSSLF